jgi:nucleoside-diphosphate-sugar epimerase
MTPALRADYRGRHERHRGLDVRPARRLGVRIFVTGGSGVLGRASIPLLLRDGHDVTAPGHAQLDLFARDRIEPVLAGCDAVFHLATRIPSKEAQAIPEAWRENDRLRSEGTAALVDAALACDVGRFVFPSIAFVYPTDGPVDEDTPVADDLPATFRSALEAESQVARFALAGGAGVVLRMGLLYGPGTGSETPAERWAGYGATVRIEDAAQALVRALRAPTGTYNVVGNGQRVANAHYERATGWRPDW